MIESFATHDAFLGMPVKQFLAEYWQKKPLLIRQAFPDYQAPLSPEDLAGLACEQGPLARLVTYQREQDKWHLRNGPFEESEFPTLGHKDWTLLVQDMDKWDGDIAQLLEAFHFLPRWRIDDIMISFAVEGGSVGPHIDQYDVFLLQAQGHRQWQIENLARHEPAFREDSELKLLVEFKPTHTWDLAPGDMLYLPPGYAHHGVALDACMTFSVGTRAPSSAEMITDFIDDLAQKLPEYQRFEDPDLSPSPDPFEIDTHAFERVKKAFSAMDTATENDRKRWFGEFITRYRASGDISADPTQLTWSKVLISLHLGQALLIHPFARLAWNANGNQAVLYVSGDSFDLPVNDAMLICQQKLIDSITFNQLSVIGQQTLENLYQQGFYQLVSDQT